MFTPLCGANEALGEKNFAVVLLDYANDSKQIPVAKIREGLFESEFSVARFISEASYGKTKFSGEIFGWINPKEPLSGREGATCWPAHKRRFNLLLEHYPFVDLRKYDGFLFYIRRKSGQSCSFGRANTYGLQERPTYTQFGKQPFGVIKTRIAYAATKFHFPYEIYSNITNSTIAHELIHTLGISHHSNGYSCPNNELTLDYRKCRILSRSDLFSIMGLRSQASHPNAINKENIGWLSRKNIINVTQPETYRVYSLSQQDDNVKALKIKLHHPIDISDKIKFTHVYIEYRGKTGFDFRPDGLRRLMLKDKTMQSLDNFHGALIYGADCVRKEGCMPYLLNMNPKFAEPAYPPHIFVNAYLHRKKKFEVPRNNLSVEVVNINLGKYIDVKISREN